MPAYARNFDQRELDRPLYATAAAATDGSNATLVTITIRNGMGKAVPCEFGIRLSDNASGIGLTATTASGNVTDKTAGTTGQLLATQVAKKALWVQTTAAGTYQLSITDTAKTAFVVAAVIDGLVMPLATLATASYG
jgi:hypothetical protein